MKRIIFILILLCLAVRLLGVLWGFNLFSRPHFVVYVPDEVEETGIAHEYLSYKANIWQDYPKGFGFQVSLLAELIQWIRPIEDSALVLMGRLLSVFYSLLTVVLVYLLMRELSSDPRMALASSAFYGFAELPVTNSHYSTVDTTMVFWFYATIFYALLTLRRNKNIYFFLSLFSFAVALSVKMPWVLAAPVVYVLFKQKRSFGFGLLAIGCIWLFFMMANGGHYVLQNFMGMLHNIKDDNLFVINHNKLFNPILYTVDFVCGMGLASFLLLLYGGFQSMSLNFFNKILKKDYTFVVILPVVLHFISVCFLAYMPPRHVLPVIPLLAMVSGYGLVQLMRIKIFDNSRIRTAVLLSAIFGYQLFYVTASQCNFLFDTQVAAGQWIKENIPYGTKVGTTPFTVIPLLDEKYKPALDDFDSPYFVMNEHHYYRYRRSFLNPFEEYPDDPNKIMHDQDRGHVHRFQAMLKGQPPYKLIKRFAAEALTPEMSLYKKYWGSYLFFCGDTLIYKRE